MKVDKTTPSQEADIKQVQSGEEWRNDVILF